MSAHGGLSLLGVDVGGTFTDAVLIARGRLRSVKVPSTPAQPERAILDALAALLEGAPEPTPLARFAHGMTVATNALLEGRMASTALIATEGFCDIIELARQQRAELYRPCAPHPPALSPPERRLGARERTLPEGVERELSAAALQELIAAIAAAEVQAVAVCLLHSYAHPQHEQMIAEALAEALPDVHVSLSHELVGTIREYERAATTELDAALSPLLSGYLRALGRATARRSLCAPSVISSSGGLLDIERAAAHAALTLLSGPAGGVRGAQLIARRAGEPDALCFDMGGTSCDVCLIRGGEVGESAQRTLAGRPVALPALDIITIGAGGGSIAWRDRGGALCVGPRSAGASPGPACYGRGGSEPTVTDANLLLGRLRAEVALAGGLRLDPAAAERAIAALANSLGIGTLACAEGIVRVAEEEMARALRLASVERGIDPRSMALLAFGGAGPLHAAALAQALGIERVLVPGSAGVLSALGLAAAPPRADVARTVLLAGEALSAERIRSAIRELLARASAALREPTERVRVTYELRYVGQSFELPVIDECTQREPEVDVQRLCARFGQEHERRFGYRQEGEPIELVTIRVSAFGGSAEVAEQALVAAADSGEAPPLPISLICDGSVRPARLHRRLPEPGEPISGPAVIALASSTVLVPERWQARTLAGGTLQLRVDREVVERDDRRRELRRAPAMARPARRLDPVSLRISLGALHSICEEMGSVLVRASHSANIKERRDASSALFDAAGQLVMQAEHIPVHLGAMPEAVAAVLGFEQRPGSSFILNDPYAGGTHLPDITIITPAFLAGELIGFAATRAHHADVGASEPGSMPAHSRTLAEEGIVIAPQRIETETIERLVASMRQPRERRADLRAQLASCRLGAERLRALASSVGAARLHAQLDAVLDYAERRMRSELVRLRERHGEELHNEDVLEGSEHELTLRLRVLLGQGSATLDFRGSAPADPGNLNCPLAVTRSACYYALRVLCDPDIPPCAGSYRPLQVLADPGSILDARPPAAVAAGNVETSSRVADLVLGAFGRALGQGTMNNLTLGNERFSYYETIGGGQGACPDAPGPSGVHVAMSNTLNTPVETLERDYPLRVRSYAIRRGSGGEGRHQGGDGVVREIEAREQMRFSLIAERRSHPPRGAQGGADGAPGRDRLLRAGGPALGEPLAAKSSGTLQPGWRIRVETPGGGGFGSPARRRRQRPRQASEGEPDSR
ncbi:MAG TPA: hydantoinase B/oxoprolinase family protein [Solirubrobacteraceae bacterium]|nr:hydantoinase B/oxoprolinase family protein [Solirubrobacteraceae bacterium]